VDRELLKKMGDVSPYFKHLDMELIEAEEGYAKVTMRTRPYHANLMGVVHGGAIASLADQAAMRAIQTNLPKPQVSSTIQMDIHYLAPARGGSLVAEGRVKKMGTQLAFSDVEVIDEKGETIAIARCTIAIMKEKGKK
jgi:uncharacterized protein (TIGR00369 family)